MDGVIARQVRGVLVVAGFDERTDAGEYAQDVLAGRDFLQVGSRGFEDEVDLPLLGTGLQIDIGMGVSVVPTRVRPS